MPNGSTRYSHLKFVNFSHTFSPCVSFESGTSPHPSTAVGELMPTSAQGAPLWASKPDSCLILIPKQKNAVCSRSQNKINHSGGRFSDSRLGKKASHCVHVPCELLATDAVARAAMWTTRVCGTSACKAVAASGVTIEPFSGSAVINSAGQVIRCNGRRPVYGRRLASAEHVEAEPQLRIGPRPPARPSDQVGD